MFRGIYCNWEDDFMLRSLFDQTLLRSLRNEDIAKPVQRLISVVEPGTTFPRNANS